MSDYINLIGAEDVRRAGSTISSAAETIQGASNSFAETIEMHKRFMEDWLLRFEEVLNSATK